MGTTIHRFVAAVLFLGVMVSACSDENAGLPSVTAPDADDKCPGHRIDGEFSGWPDIPKCNEYTSAPVSGMFGELYVDYDGEFIYVLNDWHLKTDSPCPADFYNLFLLTTGSGTQQWEVRVYGNQTTEVWLNGDKVEDAGQTSWGATTFGASPLHGEPHTIFEFALKVESGFITIKEADPGVGTDDQSPEDALVDEPTITSGTLGENGGATLAATTTPILLGVVPGRGAPGDTVNLTTANLPETQGTVRFDGLKAEVVSWTPTQIVAIVPNITDDSLVTVTAGDQDTNGILFRLACSPQCADKACGDPGCIGTCGQCPDKQELCSYEGTCVCAPQCDAKNCGPDGCGGTCGECAPESTCEDGVCSCEPKCEQKACGDDGCGGSCGECPPDSTCENGVCSCEPQCGSKVCGDDGCGGSCGDCKQGDTCTPEGTCVCIPKCTPGTPNACGDDGCGNSCGECTDGLECANNVCQCIPTCLNKACGDDGCGNSCGTCETGSECVDNQCQCIKLCDGKECGPDGCGGKCGTCPEGTGCANGKCFCAPDCIAGKKVCGDNGCGGTCGECLPVETCVDFKCVPK